MALFAHELADASEPIIMKHFRAISGRPEVKIMRMGSAHLAEREAVPEQPYPDVVTAADREVEEVIRRMIGARYPAHAIVGEEFGVSGDPLTSECVLVCLPLCRE